MGYGLTERPNRSMCKSGSVFSQERVSTLRVVSRESSNFLQEGYELGCQRKIVLGRAKQARKTLFKTTAIEERLNLTPLKQWVGEFLSPGMSQWKSHRSWGGPVNLSVTCHQVAGLVRYLGSWILLSHRELGDRNILILDDYLSKRCFPGSRERQSLGYKIVKGL